MAGTKAGAAKARATNLKKHGADFYARIGAKGGKLGRTGGFASNLVGEDGLTGRQRAIRAGQAGGRISRRGPATKVNKITVHDQSQTTHINVVSE
ncbi:MAG: hypothetical protein LBM09_03015 [Candidatus Nomurabacteria bacterium]|jgi:hypothetical protein|nr:hypothetical protein [Candidatus Nomurabacteria bacterium]